MSSKCGCGLFFASHRYGLILIDPMAVVAAYPANGELTDKIRVSLKRRMKFAQHGRRCSAEVTEVDVQRRRAGQRGRALPGLAGTTSYYLLACRLLC